MEPRRTLVIACGALARELLRIRELNGWDHVEIQCLPARLHNSPAEIPGAVRAKIEAMEAGFDRVFIAYADCGTAGALDRVLDDYGIERIPGAHCYEFFAGHESFYELADEEPGSFYLTDFLVRHFDRLVIGGLGLDRHPELAEHYFRNYRRVVHLAQDGEEALRRKAAGHAQRLGLDFVYRHHGDEPLASVLTPRLVNARASDGAQQVASSERTT